MNLSEFLGRVQPLRLDAKHLADLRGSGVGNEMIQAAGLCSVDWPEARALLGPHIVDPDTRCRGGREYALVGPPPPLGRCLAFPYHAADGYPLTYVRDGRTTPYVRLKPDRPRVFKVRGRPTRGGRKGEERKPRAVKYEAPAGQPPHLYLPPGLGPLLADPRFPLLVTEGEKKSLKAVQEGFPCLGLSGVWNFRDKKDRKLLADFCQVEFRGRRRPRLIVPAFDSDLASNRNVALALAALTEQLRRLGAMVRPLVLDGDGGAKVGLDDFLVKHGPEELLRLLRSVHPLYFRVPWPAEALHTSTEIDTACGPKGYDEGVANESLVEEIPSRDSFDQLSAQVLAPLAESIFVYASRWDEPRVRPADLAERVAALERDARLRLKGQRCPATFNPVLRTAEEYLPLLRLAGESIIGKVHFVTCRRNSCRPCFGRNKLLLARQVVSLSSPLRYAHVPMEARRDGADLVVTVGGAEVFRCDAAQVVDLAVMTAVNDAAARLIDGSLRPALAALDNPALDRNLMLSQYADANGWIGEHSIRQFGQKAKEAVCGATWARLRCDQLDRLRVRPGRRWPKGTAQAERAIRLSLPLLRVGPLYLARVRAGQVRAALRAARKAGADGTYTFPCGRGLHAVASDRPPTRTVKARPTLTTLYDLHALLLPSPQPRPRLGRTTFVTTSRSWKPLPRPRKYQLVAVTGASREELVDYAQALEDQYPDLRVRVKGTESAADPHVRATVTVEFSPDWLVEEVDQLLQNLVAAGADPAAMCCPEEQEQRS
jgi:hypothetical protein